MSDPKKLLALLSRPKEPIFLQKKLDNTTFDIQIPKEYYDDERFEGVNERVVTRFTLPADETVLVDKLPVLPNLDFTKKLDRDGAFSLFLDSHLQIASQLIEMFMQAATVDELMSLSTYVRERVNSYLFQYAFSVALQHRADTKDLDIPSVLSTMPDQFVDPKVIPQMKIRASVFEDQDRKPIQIPREFTASDREDEHLLAYFREDIGVNLHHWHWHLVYPSRGPRAIVDKNRRGELFYYMHTQMITRYNVERICNSLAQVVPLNNLRESVPEAYFPKIIRGSNNRAYPPRVKDSFFKNLDRIDSGTKLEIADLERWRDRVIEAIDRGYVETPFGERILLDEFNGIDMLGNMVEPSDLSVNRNFYGELHNAGHDIISYVHDPDYKHLEDYSVMGDVATAVRDPIFYRWHGFIDSVFQRHKNKLAQYTTQQLGFNGVMVDSVVVKLANNANAPPNNLLTVWTRSAVDLQAGLDFNDMSSIFAEFTHLNHAPFVYNIQVTNNSGEPRRGTCRVFLAPKRDERNNLLPLKNQRPLMIEMDKWSVNLAPGPNYIVRKSCDSNVTLPHERTFRSVRAPQENVAQYRFCSCGWPHHMLVPKGSQVGMEFDLFVMISNGADDEVIQEVTGECNDSHVFCGIRDKLYPDKRNMGFPFDRQLDEYAYGNLQTFVGAFGNMKSVDLSIKHVDRVVDSFTC